MESKEEKKFYTEQFYTGGESEEESLSQPVVTLRNEKRDREKERKYQFAKCGAS